MHSIELLEALSLLSVVSLEQRVYRVTGPLADPVAFSQNGGRWASLCDREGGCPILYTSLTPEGAISEVASYLGLLDPIPRKGLVLHELDLSLAKAIHIQRADFVALGIDAAAYAERKYGVTQMIGSAVNFLGFDGLIAPSARWGCDNAMVYEDNHPMDRKLDVVSAREVPFEEWHGYATQD